MTIKEILSQSRKAMGESFGKEVIIDADEVFKTRKDLKDAGFTVIETSPAGFGGKKKILFNQDRMSL